MRRLVFAALLCAPAGFVRGDFTFQETAQITGGILVDASTALGPLSGGSSEPIVSTNILKGNRMATITEEHISVIDLDQETITDIDSAKKTYSIRTFAELKQAMEDSRRFARQTAAGERSGDGRAPFNVSANVTGKSKNVQGLIASEMVITMTSDGRNAKSGDTADIETTIDAWYAAVPGYGEVKEFDKKMAAKFGDSFGSGIEQFAHMAVAQAGGANMNEGIGEVAQALSKIDGAPVESVFRISGSLPNVAPARLGEVGRREKNDEPHEQPQQTRVPAGQMYSGTLMELTMTLSGFSSRPVDTAKFEIPAGFAQVQSGLPRAAH